MHKLSSHASWRGSTIPAWTSALAFLAFAATPALPAQSTVSVAAFGARADGILRTDGAMTAGSAILTSASSSFNSADVGKYIQVIGAGPGGTSHLDGTMSSGSTILNSPTGMFSSSDIGRGIIIVGAGPGGSNLITAIQGYSSPTSVTLDASALATVSNTPYYYGAMTLESSIQSVLNNTTVALNTPAVATITSATFAYGTNNSPAFQSAIDSVGKGGGGTITVPQPTTCPAGAVCGYVTAATDQMTATAPGAIKIRYNNISLVGDDPQTNLFCRGAWKTYTNSVSFGSQTATIRGTCVSIGDNGGTRGAAGTSVSNVTVAKLHLYGMTNGNTYSVNFTPTAPPMTTTGDGWDETHKALYMWDNSNFSNITIDSVFIQDFKGENIYSGGSTITGMVIKNCTLTNFNGDGISMLAADLQVLNNNISNGSNSGIENSTRSVTSAALVRQIYQSNTVSYMQREGINVVGVDSGLAAGSVQIVNNYFDTIGQIHGNGARVAIYVNPQSSGDVAPGNVTVSNNTCHDCYSFLTLPTGGNTQVTANTFVVDKHNCNSFMTFMNPLSNILISSNTGYRTSSAIANSRKLAGVYMIDPGYQSGSFVWTNARLQNNVWSFAGMPHYTFVTSSGLGFNIVGHHNLAWQGETCPGCTYPDQDHGLVKVGSGTTIEPYGPVVSVAGNSGPVTLTVDPSKEEDGSEVQIVNAGANSIEFVTDSNLSLPSSVTLPGGVHSSVTFVYRSGIGKFTLPGGSGSVNATAGTPQSTAVNSTFATLLEATMKDSGGNLVSGAMVTFSAPAGGPSGTFGGAVTAMTNGNGVATAPPLTANSQAGGYTVTASAPGVGALASFRLTNTMGAPASISSSEGTPQSTGVNTTFATTLKATVKDSGGNPVSGVAVTFSTPASGPSGMFGGGRTASAVTNVSGLATAPALMANNQGGSYTVTAVAAGVGTAANFSLTNTTGVGSGGSLIGSVNSSAGLVNLTTEGSVDWEQWGEASPNRKSGVTPQLTSYTAVGAGTIFSYANDLRPVSWIDGAPTASSANNVNGVFISGLGQGFSFTAPADIGVRSLVVHVGGWLSGGTVTAHLSDGSAPDFVDVTAAAGGQYDRNYLLIYHAAAARQTLTLTWVMTSGTGNVTLNAAALAGASMGGSIVASGGTPQSAAVNKRFATALQATVKDSGGNPVSGVTVTFTPPGGGASATFTGLTSVTTNVSGVATSPALTASSQMGSYMVIASVAGAGTVASFSLTNTVGVPASIVASGGTPQSAAVNTGFATALQATVRDTGGNPVGGVAVTFAAPSSGATATFGGSASVTTNSNGVATAPTLTANSKSGSYTVSASVAGVGTTASFSLTNTGAVAAGSLQGVANNSATAVNLTTEGSVDWLHWGDGGLNRKAGVTPQLSNYAVVGTGNVLSYNNDPRSLSWTDGAPTASSSNNRNGTYIRNVGQGFSFTAPADPTLRSLVVHVGGWSSGGTLTAHLSDGSAADFTDVSGMVSGQYDRNYSLTYNAASAGHTLTVTWKMTSGSGNVTLNAVTLR